MTGKNKCKILKEIRSKIAQENDIPFITRECTYQGQCKGTCPKCEQELAYLEQQLARRQQLGKLVTVSALALGITLGSVGCQPEIEVLEGDVPYVADTQDEWETTPGDPEEIEPVEPSKGLVEIPTKSEDVEVLEGDVAWIEDEITEEPSELVAGELPLAEDSGDE